MSDSDSSPEAVARATQDVSDVAGDAADQAERLSMVMEAEAIRSGLRGTTDGEGSLDGLLYPLEDTEDVLAAEEAEDSSDDPMHAGGLTPAPLIPAEQAAMHIIGDDNELGDDYVGDLAADADPFVDPFDREGSELTAEDETLLGIDPYEK
ncbi:MAG: hypothetical protein WAO41_09460 [Candidatus Nanopelagicales bacterium]